MRYSVLIITLVSILGCGREPETSKCAYMTPSDALPLQIWPIGQQTFNEYNPGFPIIHECYTVERQCDDPLKLQFVDDPAKGYYISFFKKDGSLVTAIPFIETSQNEEIINGVFTVDLDGFSQGGLGDPLKINSWSWDSGGGGRIHAAISQIGSDISNTKVIKKTCIGLEGPSTVTAKWGLIDSGVTTKTAYLKLVLIRDGIIVQTVDVDSKAGATSSFTRTITDLAFTANTNYDQVGMCVTFTDPSFSTQDAQIYNFSVESLQPSSYDLTVTPQDIGVCEDSYQLFISTGGPSADLVYPTPIDTWSPLSGSPAWTVDADGAHAVLSTGETTRTLFIPVSGVMVGDALKVFLELIASLPATTSHIQAAFYGAGPTATSNIVNISTILTDNPSTSAFVITGSVTEIRISLTLTSAPTSPITYTLNKNLRIYKSAGINIYKSEFVRYSSDIAENTLIRYKSFKNFAGIVYPNDGTYFSIRIPGVFYHQRFPTEQKGIELSNSREINTGSVLKLQKLLSIQDAPYYIHNKLILILQHAVSGSVVINNVEWTVEETYTLEDGDPMHEMRQANIFLTRRNYVDRNVI